MFGGEPNIHMGGPALLTTSILNFADVDFAEDQQSEIKS